MISISNVSIHFRMRRRQPIRALDDVTLAVREGEFFALLGENGAGKSTAMHCMLGLIRPTKGSVQLFGQPPLLEPRLLFLDEPMRGLDPRGVKDFREMLVELNRRGCTIVMNSHILAEVESVATSAAILKRGRVVACDRLENLAHDVERYEVTFEGEVAGYVTVVERQEAHIRGTLPPERVADFLAAAAAGSVRLHSFQRSHQSLEQTFLSLIDSEATHA